MEPWLARLNDGDTNAAWDLFVDRYRRLIVATIKRVLTDGDDDVMDVFASVCESLTADAFARLRRFAAKSPGGANLSAWLVAVVRNQTIDWLRQRDGRRRVSIPLHLSPLQREIFAAVCIAGHSYVEAYEIIRARTGSQMPFHLFLREVRDTQREAPCVHGLPRRVRSDSPRETSAPDVDAAESVELARHLGAALSSQPPDVRLAVELFVVERIAAADVARVVGWPDAKSVYNRVYRALAAMRQELERRGIGRGDLL